MRWSLWEETEWLDVLLLDGDALFGRDERGTAVVYEQDPTVEDEFWIKVERPIPIPHRYIGPRHDGGVSTNGYPDKTGWNSKLIAELLHIWTDEDGVDRIKRVKP